MINFKQKSVVILGAGMTGLSLLRYCLKKDAKITVMDSRYEPPLLEQFKEELSAFTEVEFDLVLGHFDKGVLSNADYILVSPGVDLNALPVSRDSIASKLLSDIEIFAAETEVPIIAVTGSNGKSTVCDALGFVLNNVGKHTIVAGNIGLPVVELLEQESPELYVLELSSFQLDLVKSLKVSAACILNITEDHLDRHGSMAHYIRAKQSIYNNAGSCIFNFDDELTRPNQFNSLAKNVTTLTFGQHEKADFRVVLESLGFSVEHQGEVLITENEVMLKGMHNGLNIAAIFAILTGLEIAIESNVLEALKQYPGLAHRCQRVELGDGILWVNDSKATNVGSAVSAIVSFRSKCNCLFLIAGGDLKGADCHELTRVINQQVDEVWAFGKDADILVAGITSGKAHHVKSLSEAVSGIKEKVKSGDCVLLSPAGASTDMYRNYQERGEHFIQLLQEAS